MTPTLRYQDDKDTGAVTMTVSPSNIVVGPHGTRYIEVTLNVDSTKLRNNQMNAGSLGNAIGPLTANEYDGYVVLQNASHKLTVPWHILPRKSADVVAKLPGGHLPPVDPLSGVGFVSLENKGVGDAQIFAYSMLGTGPDTPRGDRGDQAPNPTIRAAAVNTFLTPAGFTCSVNPNFVWEFVFNMYERKASPVGTIHEVDIDVNNDGANDFFRDQPGRRGSHCVVGWPAGDGGAARVRRGHDPVDVDLLLRGERHQHGQLRAARLRERDGV